MAIIRSTEGKVMYSSAGIGIDLIKVSKVERLLSGGKKPLKGIFTLAEIEYCQKKPHQIQHFAARLAVKEAVFKALGTGGCGGIKWTDIEVVKDEMGRPKINLHGKAREMAEKMNIRDILVSLSHCSDYAIAQVILALSGADSPKPLK